jgi:hypothetical protein
MSILQLVLITFGIIPIAGVFLQKFIFGLLPLFGIGRFGPQIPRQVVEKWYQIPGEPVPWSPIGRSFVRRGKRFLHQLSPARELQFHTLRCEADPSGDGKWLLSITFEVWNPPLAPEIVIDDLHVRLFEKDAFAPPLATISYFGDVWLRQDNSILKDGRDYELKSGDGYQINLVLQATRVEGAPAYGMLPTETAGQLLVVFGLLLDYYWREGATLKRATLPSDRIYVFNSSGKFQGSAMLSIDSGNITSLATAQHSNRATEKLVERLGEYVREHSSFRPVPKA